MMTEDELICLAFWLEKQISNINSERLMELLEDAADGNNVELARTTLFVLNNLASVTARLVEVAESLCEEYEGESDGS